VRVIVNLQTVCTLIMINWVSRNVCDFVLILFERREVRGDMCVCVMWGGEGGIKIAIVPI
jgi:hypothetical protein